MKLLTLFDIDSVAKRFTEEISQGELQRMYAAASIAHNPQYIFADEPTSNLDDANCSLLMNSLSHYSESNQAQLVVVSHDQRLTSFFSNQIRL